MNLSRAAASTAIRANSAESNTKCFGKVLPFAQAYVVAPRYGVRPCWRSLTAFRATYTSP